MVAVAIGSTVAGVVGAGASIASGDKAASAAKDAANENNSLQAQIYGQNTATLSPYVGAGNAATEQLRRLLGVGDSNTGTANSPYTAQQQQQGAVAAFQQGAPYQAALQQGQKSVQAALGAQGLLDSGAAQKSLLSYGDTFLNNQLNTYEGQLAGLSNTGLSGASAQAGVGQGYANSVSANNNNAANAQGNAALNTGNQINSALGSALTAYSYNQGLGSSYGGSGANAGLGGIY
jgi:hypothetical protein